MELTREQNTAIKIIDSNLQIIACAGSGKTEVITRRIAHILAQKPEIAPRNIVAFTFTEKAAAAMKSRIAKALIETQYSAEALDGMYVGTIHSYCYTLLSKYSERFDGFRVLDTVKNHLFIQRYHDKCGMSDLGLRPYLHDIKLFCDCIGKMVDDYDNRDTWSDLHQEVFEKYRTCLYEHDYLDFSLLILEAVLQIRDNPEVTKALGDVRYLVVDEYQDVDDLQEKLVRCFSHLGANICVVGDDDQTIYQFRGSNAGNMIDFARNYPNVTQVRLENNFRCAEGIVDIADTVIQNNENRLAKKMVSAASHTGRFTAKAQRFDDSEDQYSTIATEIQELHQHRIPYKEMSVLVRKGKFIGPICQALDKQCIPYSTDNADYFFEGNYFGRFVETLRIFTDIDKAKLHDCWKDFTDETHFSAGFKYLRRVARSGGDGLALPLSGVICAFLEQVGFLDATAHDIQARQDDLAGFSQILDDYDEIFRDWQLTGRIKGLLRFLETDALEEYKYHSFKSDESLCDAVQIMTVHKSKGLEFHTVFLPNLMDKEFPMSNRGGKQYWHVLGGSFEENKGRYESDIDDERKLFYVAVTRAKQNLYLYYELTKKRVSTFILEAASSEHLEADRAELRANSISIAETKELRKKITDDIYAMASVGMKAALLDLDRVYHADGEELLQLAKQYGFK